MQKHITRWSTIVRFALWTAYGGRLPQRYSTRYIMKTLITLILFFSFNVIACNEIGITKENVYARVIDGDSEIIEVAIFYPNALQEGKLDTVSILYNNSKKVFISVDVNVRLVNANILRFTPDLKGIDMNRYNWSHIVLAKSALDNVEIVMSYQWPATEDGVATICGPQKRIQLKELLKGV